MLAQNREGNQLLQLLRSAEHELSRASLTQVRVIARHEDKVLLVFERRQQRWQLVGGATERGETARGAATRQLREQSSHDCKPSALRFLGAVELLVGPTLLEQQTHREWGALYAVDIDHLAAFIPNEEIGATMWWSGAELSHELDGIDRKLIELSGEREPSTAAAEQGAEQAEQEPQRARARRGSVGGA